MEALRQQADALIFIAQQGGGARYCAVVVSADPAVICVDVTGQFAISLLSGALAEATSQAKCPWHRALPVITTATDISQRFAVDDERNNDFMIAV